MAAGFGRLERIAPSVDRHPPAGRKARQSNGGVMMLIAWVAIEHMLALGATLAGTACGPAAAPSAGAPHLVTRRALPTGTDTLALVLNVPAFRLDVYEGERRTHVVRVAVGLPAYPTPIGVFTIWRVIWNPWWIPPDRPWARGERITPPGPGNPMGRVKLDFLPLYFLHGTRDVASIGHAASHGCVRLTNADAVALATLVVEHGAAPAMPARMPAGDSSWTPTDTVILLTPIPLEVRYDLAEVRGDTLLLHPDVYRRDRTGELPRALAALTRAGIPPAQIDTPRVAALARTSRRSHVATPLASILRLPEGLLDHGPPAHDGLGPGRRDRHRPAQHAAGTSRCAALNRETP